MPKTQYTKTALKEAIAGKLQRHFACEVEDATKDQVYEACALVVRDALTEHMIETQNEVEQDGERQVHYLCMEFLVGRSLRNNAYNLGMLDALTAALKDMGFEMADIFEEEADPGLGNGGLGRLAACYMDGMATDGVRGTGYSIRYEHGIFKQKIVEGQQVELPDSWLSTGEVWQIPAMDETREVKIGGTVDTYFDDNGKLVVNYHDYTPVLAVPYDMPISGYGTNNIARLRLWKAQSPIALDMKLFSSGEYLKALEKHALAETISMVLYPEVIETLRKQNVAAVSDVKYGVIEPDGTLTASCCPRRYSISRRTAASTCTVRCCRAGAAPLRSSGRSSRAMKWQALPPCRWRKVWTPAICCSPMRPRSVRRRPQANFLTVWHSPVRNF